MAARPSHSAHPASNICMMAPQSRMRRSQPDGITLNCYERLVKGRCRMRLATGRRHEPLDCGVRSTHMAIHAPNVRSTDS